MTWGGVATGVGAAAGGYFASQGGGGGATAEQPKYVKNALKPYAQEVTDFNYTPEFFGGQTYAPQSPFSQLAIEGMGNFNNQPSQDYWNSVMQGDYLGMNPSMQNAVMDPAIQATNAGFNQMGRFGSQANMQNTAEQGMRAMAPFYNFERDRQGQAAQMLPALQSGQLQQQLQGGQLQEQYAQQPINEAMQRHTFGQDAGLRDLQARQGLLGTLTGVPQNQSTDQGGASFLQGAMGGGLMGYGLYDAYQNQNPTAFGGYTPNYGVTPPPQNNGMAAIQPGAGSFWGA
jgi:hypothetical protein